MPIQQHYTDHSYRSIPVERYLTHFMAGFTAFKQKKLVKNCQECLQTIVKPREEASEGDAFTLMKESFGGYTLPSDSLVALIKAVEVAAADCHANHGVQEDMLFTTVKQYLKINADCFVGCLEHTEVVTKKILKYYLITRMYFASAMKNNEISNEKDKRKDQRRQSKA